MSPGSRRSHFKKTKATGFALAEIIMALVFVGLAIALVGGLSQQVMNLAKSSKQTAAAIELRSKSNSISRNLDSWLGKMRSSPLTTGLYASCIPDPSSVSSIHKCPDIDSNLLKEDSELAKIAGTQLHPSSAIILDLMGDKLAGPSDDPAFFDLDGRPCDNSAGKCPISAVGYMLRSNPDTNSNPGSIKFVVKIQPNLNNTMRGTTPLRTQYLTVDVGSEWQMPTNFCPSGSIKVGYLYNGKVQCINPTKSCASGTIQLGFDSSGKPICKTPPTTCASSGEHIVVDSAGSELVCAANSPCTSNQIFLGYYSGTGVPMCSGTSMSCPSGEVQIGIVQNGSNLAASCQKLPSCKDSEKLSYDGSKFECSSASVASYCQSGEIVVGINSDGSAKCAPQERNLASSDLKCEAGYYVSGLERDGSVICDPLPTPPTNPTTPVSNDLVGYVTPELDIPNDASHIVISSPHNLGKVPTIVRWVAVNKIPENGYSLGDEIDFSDLSNRGSDSYHSRTYFQNATHVGISWYYPQNYFARAIGKIINDTMGDRISSPNWKLKAYVYVSSLSPLPPGPVCTLEADVKGPQNTVLKLVNNSGSPGTCAVNGYGSQQGSSTPLSASPGQTLYGSSPSSPTASQLNPYFECPPQTTKQACAFEAGAGPFGKINCSCLK